MNQDIINGDWKQLRGHMRAKWGKLTDNDIEQISGKKDVLAGKLQEYYGHAKEIADHEIAEFYREFDPHETMPPSE